MFVLQDVLFNYQSLTSMTAINHLMVSLLLSKEWVEELGI